MATTGEIENAEKLRRHARKAVARCRQKNLRQRIELITQMRVTATEEMEDIVETICSETHKTPPEALLTDLIPTLEFLEYLENEAGDILQSQKVKTPGIFRHSTSRIEYRPKGVVLIIAPWNNPFQLSVVPAASALVAGNAVILKPSEKTPRTGKLVDRICRVAGFNNNEICLANGGPHMARELIEMKPDMIFFTGGVKNGREVLKAATTNLIPVILELGGKDPMVVFDDANLERAVNAALYGAFTHAGQHCVSTKRLYIQSPIYDSFLKRLAEKVNKLSRGEEWGHLFDDKAGHTANEQVLEAIEKGARLLAPAERENAGYVPTLVADTTHHMGLMREETFAPVLGAMSFHDEENAINFANDTPYGLNASIWSEDHERCKLALTRLKSGNVYINNVLTNVGNPYLPFGGLKKSGLGRYHASEGVRAFCDTISIMKSNSKKKTELNWFPHNEGKLHTVKELIKWKYGKGNRVQKIVQWLKLLPELIKTEKQGG